ncbi:MAG: TetR/AcrR family transcriptional regulator [Actinomycetota bacterium]
MPPTPRLSADDRRAQIIEAVTPAVLEHGVGITTRQLAEAAGVAEGTLFKAFGDKDSLLVALVEQHMDDADAAGSIETDSLDELVSTMVAVLVERMRFMFQLAMALGPLAQRVAEGRREDFEQSKTWIAAHFEPFEGQLRVTPLVAAELVRTLAWAAAAGWGEPEPTTSAADIVQVLLHGIVVTDPPTPPAAGTATSAIHETQKV